MTWLLLLPCLLGCAVVVTDWAWGLMQRAVRPAACQHRFWMYGRCGECGTPR